MSKKVLVIGGAGYIGSHVCKSLSQQGYQVTVFDNFSTGNRGAVKFGALIEGDLANEDLLNQVFLANNYHAVFHFAGSIKVPESVENPEKYYLNNSQNSLNLMRVCKKYKVKNFIFSSTAAVYGELTDGYADEDTPKNPINPYGRSKLTTEWMLEDFSAAYTDFHYAVIRYFNVCGADPDSEIGQAFPEPFHLINIACEVASGKREKMYIFGDNYNTPDGTCVRDYIHVSDLALAHVLSLNYMEKNKQSLVVNCGYGHGLSVKEIVDSVSRVTGANIQAEIVDRRDGDPEVLIAKSDKIKKILGWKPLYDNLDFIIESAFKWENSKEMKKWRTEINK